MCGMSGYLKSSTFCRLINGQLLLFNNRKNLTNTKRQKVDHFVKFSVQQYNKSTKSCTKLAKYRKTTWPILNPERACHKEFNVPRKQKNVTV